MKTSWEHLDDITYCTKKIAEVSEVLKEYPNYSDLVYDFAFKKGYRLDKARIRAVKQGRVRDRLIADLINQWGKSVIIYEMTA